VKTFQPNPLIYNGKETKNRSNPRTRANGVVYMASLSLEANVQFMTVMATKTPYIGRG
jgi:hypothetical protein